MADQLKHLQVYESDKARFDKLVAFDNRNIVLEFKVIVDEACERRGLDPQTLESVPDSSAGNNKNQQTDDR